MSETVERPAAPSEPALVPWRWLVSLRWAAVFGQLLAVAFAKVEAPDAVSLAGPLALVGLMAASNVALAGHFLRQETVQRGDRVLAGALLVDVALLASILALTGGPANPMSTLLMVHVTLAAVVLGARLAWLLAVVAVCAFGALFLVAPCHVRHGPMHLQGMWLAFAAAATTIVFFVTRLAAELRLREARILELNDKKARSDKLVSLSTLAAGAAHELATPLGTIAIAAKELERCLATTPGALRHELVDDTRLIRREVDRCRKILDQLHARAGESTGEVESVLALSQLGRDLVDSLAPEERRRVVVDAEDADARLPRVAVLQALRTLVRNGLEASHTEVSVSLSLRPGILRCAIEDRGEGMTAEVLARAGEPFFTTKDAGRGMGLGLFLARAVAERLGGALRLQSSPGVGTVALLSLPRGDL
ncbi:MAG: HAMP domain-containing histidine kinase [Myxococcales bacterium]|nr:HAMP domain-containing histidine kinase [Myxococcales bacterium]